MNYRNAKRITPFIIDCEIEHPDYGWIPFTCNPEDTGATFDSLILYEKMNVDPNTKKYIPPTQEQLDILAENEIRAQRDQILITVIDPLVTNPLRWADLSDEMKQSWANYRRELLNITDQPGFPTTVVWPVKP